MFNIANWQLVKNIDRPNGAVGMQPAYLDAIKAWPANKEKFLAGDSATIRKILGGYGWAGAALLDQFDVPAALKPAIIRAPAVSTVQSVFYGPAVPFDNGNESYVYYRDSSIAFVRELFGDVFPYRAHVPAIGDIEPVYGKGLAENGFAYVKVLDLAGDTTRPANVPPDQTAMSQPAPAVQAPPIRPPDEPPPRIGPTLPPDQMQTMPAIRIDTPPDQRPPMTTGGPSLYLPPLPDTQPANYVRNQTPLPGMTTPPPDAPPDAKPSIPASTPPADAPPDSILTFDQVDLEYKKFLDDMGQAATQPLRQKKLEELLSRTGLFNADGSPKNPPALTFNEPQPRSDITHNPNSGQSFTGKKSSPLLLYVGGGLALLILLKLFK